MQRMSEPHTYDEEFLLVFVFTFDFVTCSPSIGSTSNSLTSPPHSIIDPSADVTKITNGVHDVTPAHDELKLVFFPKVYYFLESVYSFYKIRITLA